MVRNNINKNSQSLLVNKKYLLKTSFFCLITIFLLLVMTTSVLAQSSSELNESFEYSDKYLSAESIYNSLLNDKVELESLNLSTIRYGDLLLIAESELEKISVQEKDYYLASPQEQESLSLPDYTVLFNRLDELSTLKSLALETRDEFVVLKSFLEENNYLTDNATYKAFVQANESFYAERYEEAMVHIESAREKASEYDALETKLKALVTASSRNIKSFLQRNWYFVLTALLGFFILFFVLKKIIRRSIIKRKLHRLELRKESIRDLTKQIQKEYFSTGQLSESAYHIRLKVYGEMVRDIRRQIPLLEEELVLKRNFFGRVKTRKFNKSSKVKHSPTSKDDNHSSKK